MVVPLPGCESSTQMRPPISSTRFLLIASPSPVPPKRRVVRLVGLGEFLEQSCLHLRRHADAGVAHADLHESVRSRSAVRQRKASSTSPCSVNFTALPHRLSSTWPRRNGSPTRTRRDGRVVADQELDALVLGLVADGVGQLFQHARRGRTRPVSMSSLPASILEKSRMSLMMPSSECAAPCALLS